MARDTKTLAHVFGIPITDPCINNALMPKRRRATVYVNTQGIVAHLEKCGSQWEGHFENDHSTTFICDTKRELVFDMNVAPKQLI